jgi:ketosteroid isomerase-like protein
LPLRERMSVLLKERIYKIYQTFSAGRFDELADLFDERVEFISNAPIEVFPYLGRRSGRAQVMEALRAVHEHFSSVEFMPLNIITDEESAGIIVSIRLTERATSRAIRLVAAHFLQFKDNRIVDYRAFLDTFEAVQQTLGREFDLS